MSVPVPDGEDSRGFLQLLSQATHFPIAVLKQQITGYLHVVVEFRTEGPGSYAGAPPFNGRQEGELNCDVCVNSDTGKVAESFILFRNKPKIQKRKQGEEAEASSGKNGSELLNSTQENRSLRFCFGLHCISV